MKKLHRILFCIFLCASSPLLAQYSLKESRSKIINDYTKDSLGKDLDLSQIDHLVRDISQSGLFQMVYAEIVSPGVVEINAQEAQKLMSVEIEGSLFFDDEELLSKIDLKSSQKVSTLQIKEGLEKIEKLYSDAGFFDTKVTYATEPDEDGLKLTFKIQEGRSCIVQDISIFSSNKTLNKKSRDLLAEFKNLPFKQSTIDQIRKSIEDFFVEKRYLVAEIEKVKTQFNPEKTKVKINVSIKDPTLFEFIFFGNKYFSHFDLIKQSRIGGKFLYLSNSSSEMADNIRDFYRKHGFPDAKVTYKETDFVDLNKKVIVVSIEEGRRVRLARIKISGKLSKPKSYYLNVIEEELSEESKNIYFVRSAIDRATEILMTKLKNEGYLLAEAIPPTITFNGNGDAIVNIQIDEGMLTYIRQVLFRGSRAFSNLRLRDEVALQSNTPLDLKRVEASFSLLESFYQEQGFLEFKIKNRDASIIKYNEGQPFADIVYEINEGPKIRVKEIRVQGNTKTKSYVILRELAFEPGEILTRSKVLRSIDLLEKTGFFSDVSIQTLEKNTEESQRTVVVEVSERFPGLFSTGFGVNNELQEPTVRGYLGVVYNNLSGKARAISSRVDLKYSTRAPVYFLENRLALGYYEPYLFKNRIRGRASLVRDEQVFSFQDRFVSGNSGVQETIVTILSKNELNLSAEKELNENVKLNYRMWGFSNQTTFDRSPDRKNSKTINIGTTGPALEFDYRNDKFLPTSGTFTRWDLEYADPLLGSSRDNLAGSSKEINFYKTTLGTTFYLPLTRSRKYVWANSVRGGYLKNISSRSSSGIPAVKSFFLGGSSTIRGFQNTTERIPNVQELCKDPGNCQLADFFVPDESYFYLLKSELRFPILESFGGLIFYDGGAVLIDGVPLSDPYRESIGAGIRIETAVGAFVIEVGFKLDRKKNNPLYPTDEDPFAIHFALGSF